MDDAYNQSHEALGFKSLYCVGLMLTALEYNLATLGTEENDPQLYADTLALYDWVETYLARTAVRSYPEGTSDVTDGIYWCSFYDIPGRQCPDGVERPLDIHYAGSVSALFGNMGMAVVHKMLYDTTNDPKYLKRAVETANAIADSLYDDDGIFLNDRDTWTDSAFTGYFVREIMPLEGVSRKLGKLLVATAFAVMKNCREMDGHYTGDWNGGDVWSTTQSFHGGSEYMMTCANSVHMIFAAYAAVSEGLVDMTDTEIRMLLNRQ
jgi:hypothetical protein